MLRGLADALHNDAFVVVTTTLRILGVTLALRRHPSAAPGVLSVTYAYTMPRCLMPPSLRYDALPSSRVFHWIAATLTLPAPQARVCCLSRVFAERTFTCNVALFESTPLTLPLYALHVNRQPRRRHFIATHAALPYILS